MVINQLRPPCSVSLTLYTHTHFKLASQPICDSCKMQNANVNLNVNANHQGHQLSSQEIRFGRCILTHPIVRSPSVFSFSFSLTAQLDLTRKKTSLTLIMILIRCPISNFSPSQMDEGSSNGRIECSYPYRIESLV